LRIDADRWFSKSMNDTTLSPFRSAALELAPAAALVANYCDHAEHVEELSRDWIAEAAETLQSVVVRVAGELGLNPIEIYGARLRAIEARNVLANDGSPDGGASVAAAKTWRDLQLVQVEHDRYYHPDVLGLSKADQLRHYAFHLAKLVGAFAASTDEIELREVRLPDVLLFAIKLRTLIGARLPDDPLPR
jgi:hypothetical protein